MGLMADHHLRMINDRLTGHRLPTWDLLHYDLDYEKRGLVEGDNDLLDRVMCCMCHGASHYVNKL